MFYVPIVSLRNGYGEEGEQIAGCPKDGVDDAPHAGNHAHLVLQRVAAQVVRGSAPVAVIPLVHAELRQFSHVVDVAPFLVVRLAVGEHAFD